jgi:hypothetical protein
VKAQRPRQRATTARDDDHNAWHGLCLVIANANESRSGSENAQVTTW